MQATEFEKIANKYASARPETFVKGVNHEDTGGLETKVRVTVTDKGNLAFYEGRNRLILHKVDVPKLIKWQEKTFLPQAKCAPKEEIEDVPF